MTEHRNYIDPSDALKFSAACAALRTTPPGLRCAAAGRMWAIVDEP
jgi:hypothetical protein